MRRTLAEAKKDKRVNSIVKYNSGDEFEETCYCIDLADGYEFDDGSCTQWVRTVKEIWQCLDTEVIEMR